MSHGPTDHRNVPGPRRGLAKDTITGTSGRPAGDAQPIILPDHAHDSSHTAHKHHDHDGCHTAHKHDHGPHDHRETTHKHEHGHHHHHHGAGRALTWALVLNGAFLVIEVAVGLLTDSLALLSDATHMVSDVAALALALFVSVIARRPATPARTFGYARAEVLGAFVNAAALVAVCIVIFKEGIERLAGEPPTIPGVPMLVVGVAGLAINLGSAWFLWRSAKENLNVRAALTHMLADALGSVGAIVAAVSILAFGWYAADAIASLLIGALVLAGAWGLLKESTRVLLDFAPPGLDAARLAEALCELDGVTGTHDVHIWGQQGRESLTAHLELSQEARPFEVIQAAEALIRQRFGIRHSTLQISPSARPCHQARCPLQEP